MNATPFLMVCLLFFGIMGAVAVSEEFPGNDATGKSMALFFVFMAAWAAGLLLQPRTI